MHFFFGVPIDLLAVDTDGADLGFRKPIRIRSDDRLANTASAENAESFASIHNETDVIENLALAKPQRDMAEGDQRPGRRLLFRRDRVYPQQCPPEPLRQISGTSRIYR